MGLAPGMIDLYVCLPNVFIEGKITFPDIKSVFLYNKSMNYTFRLRISPSCPATSKKKTDPNRIGKARNFHVLLFLQIGDFMSVVDCSDVTYIHASLQCLREMDCLAWNAEIYYSF